MEGVAMVAGALMVFSVVGGQARSARGGLFGALVLGFVFAGGASGSAIGLPGPGPDYGYQWATIGDPGNRDVSQAELAAWGPHPNFSSFTGGGVDYEYRMAKHEVTTAQWFEFVQAAWPVVGSIPFERDRLAGGTLTFSGGQWFMFGDPMRPASPHWTWAARYCNWLHNGKGTDPASWESGVYDASTFYVDGNGVPQHDLTRAPGAKFFLPTLDEWKKAGHWDPGKNGGAGGYWLYPHGSDEPPVPGYPEDGGQTSVAFPIDPALQKIGLYPDVMSPWGLLDMSGGVREFTQDTKLFGTFSLRNAVTGGTWGLAASDDRFDDIKHLQPHSSIFTSNIGIRLAGAVPNVGTAFVLSFGILFVRRHRGGLR